ncbi:hypothetical protein WJS89_08795 [Sphingomicrobium sp. XHP0235]|uniref:hypothetical protein n=1 Tax=Sphingomicrobium aquimarinum TaxID=3133971 RepID=UPI0031FEE8BA
MRSLFTIAAGAALLSACGDTDTQTDAPVEVRGELQDGLFELSAVNRDIAIKRAIRGAGGTCERVLYSGYVTQYENLDMWTARCDADVDWAVFVGSDDTAQIRYCADVVEQGLPACDITRLNSEGENQPEVSPVEPGSNEP